MMPHPPWSGCCPAAHGTQNLQISHGEARDFSRQRRRRMPIFAIEIMIIWIDLDRFG
jgi:hypothetical protein